MKRVPIRNGASVPLWLYRAVLVLMLPFCLVGAVISRIASESQSAARMIYWDVREECDAAASAWRGDL